MQDATDTNARIDRLRGEKLDKEEEKRFDKICAYIEPLKKADVVLITTPMWNFGPPWKLKQWIDTVTQAKVTFEYTAQGPRGLLTAKGAIVGSSGGAYKEGDPRETKDFLTTYLRTALAWIGIKDAATCFASGIDANKDKAEQIIAEAAEKARKLGAGM
jgi:FMN-dependent NADH-azoreductase